MITIIDNQRFAIGTVYTPRGKAKRPCTVVDVLRTYNSKGYLVRLRYVSVHEFMGQFVYEYDVCDATIAMGGGEIIQ